MLGGAIIVDRGETVELEESQPAIYDRPVGLRLLYQDPTSGAEHYLVRYPGGLKALRHRHTAAQTIVVLEGKLVAGGRTIGPGAYCHFAAGRTQHHAAADATGCLFVTIFHGPFDVEPLEEWQRHISTTGRGPDSGSSPPPGNRERSGPPASAVPDITDASKETSVAELISFHHAHGLTVGCRAFSDELRAAGHVVHTPDLYDGKTFAALDDGVRYAREVGFETIIERGRLAAEDLPNELVYAGFSLGVMPTTASLLLLSVPGASRSRAGLPQMREAGGRGGWR